MKKFLQWFERLLPRHAWIPILCCLAANMLAYYGSRLINLGREYHDAALAVDALIPFVPAFIVVYVLAFAQWGGNLLLLAHSDRKTSFYFFAGLAIAKLLCFACFLLYPTRMMQQPTVTGTDVFHRFTALIFSLDQPADNLLPSLHCLESWLCLRVSLHSRLPRWVKGANAVFTLLVFASVVLVKQHVLLDIPAGILVAEAGLLIARISKADRLFWKLDEKIHHTAS